MPTIILPWPVSGMTTLKRIGRVADLCCMCRTIRPFSVDETASSVRLLMVRLPFTRRVSLKGTCEECGLVIPIARDTYRTFLQDGRVDMATLIQETFPDIREVRTDRLSREQAFKAGAPVSPEERSFFIEEPIRAAAWMLRDIRTRTSETDRKSRDGCLLAGLFFLVLMGVVLFVEDRRIMESLMWFLLLAMVLAGVLNLRYRLFRSRRALSDQVYPLLGRSLQFFNPSREELETALMGLSAEGVKGIRRFDAAKLYAAIQVVRIRPGHGERPY